MCVRIYHVSKNARCSRRRRIEQGKILPLLLHALVMPPCSDRPINAVSQVERRHSDAAPVLGGRVCVVVGNEDGNRSFFLAFLKNKRLPYLKKMLASSKLKKFLITNVLVNFYQLAPYHHPQPLPRISSQTPADHWQKETYKYLQLF